MDINIKFAFKKLVEIITLGFSIVGLTWTSVEIIKEFFPDLLIIKLFNQSISFFIFPAIVGMAIKLVLIVKNEFKITCSIENIKIIVSIGNILNKRDGLIVVGINNQMNTKSEDIAKGSIHRKLVDKYGQEELTTTFEEGKSSINEGRNFFQKKIGEKEYLFLLMSDLNKGGAVRSTTSLLKKSIDDLFANQENMYTDGKINCMYLPLLGTGAGGLQPSKHEVVKILIERYLDFQNNLNENGISKIRRLNIVVYYKDISEIDWKELKIWIENQRDYCIRCNKLNKVS